MLKHLKIHLTSLILSVVFVFSAHADIFDIDADGQSKPLTDGILFIRKLAGYSGSSLVSGAVSNNGIRTTSDAIIKYIDQKGNLFDIDGDNQLLPLSDGILLLRYLAGFTGENLIKDAVNTAATRRTSQDIKNYLDSLIEDHYDFEFDFDDTADIQLKREMRAAADLWSSVLRDSYLNDMRAYSDIGRIIDDIVIIVKHENIDGPENILAHARNEAFNPENGMPVIATITVDESDVSLLRQYDVMVSVLAHELGHALGFSRGFFAYHNLITPDDYTIFRGQHAKQRYNQAFQNTVTPRLHPSLSHWAEADQPGGLNNELMIPSVALSMPLSKITLGALNDLGYRVNYNKAQAYNPLISALRAASPFVQHQDCCNHSNNDTINAPKTVAKTMTVNWVQRRGVGNTQGKLQKVFGTSGWNAGASSRERLPCSGKLEFQAASQDAYLMAGLSGADTCQSYRSIDYAIYLTPSRRVLIYEKGRYKGNFRSYKKGDRFSVSRKNGNISYQLNGSTFYTSKANDSRSLVADVSFYTNDRAAIENAKIAIQP